MSARMDRGQSSSQVSGWMPSAANITPLAQTSFLNPYGLTLRQTITSSGSVTIPAGITWVYVVMTGGGAAGANQGNGAGAGVVSWGWTLASSTCIIGAGGIPGSGGAGYTRHGHIIAGAGNSGTVGAGSGGATGATNYWGTPGGTANNVGSGAGGGSGAGANGGDGISGGGGAGNSTAGSGTNIGGNGGSGVAGGGGGVAQTTTGTRTGGNGGNGIGIDGTIYTGGTGSTSTSANVAGGGGAGIAGNGSNASGLTGGDGGLGGGEDGFPNVFRVMFHMAGGGEVLLEFLLGGCLHLQFFIEDDGARRCGALINGQNERRHGVSPRRLIFKKRAGDCAPALCFRQKLIAEALPATT